MAVVEEAGGRRVWNLVDYEDVHKWTLMMPLFPYACDFDDDNLVFQIKMCGKCRDYLST